MNNQSLTLLTDLYQLTMGYGYWKNNIHNTLSCFNLFFRNNPFKGGYTIACGLRSVIDFIDNFKFTDDDINFLHTIKGNNSKVLFDDDFLQYLKQLKFTCNINAVEDGQIIFPHEPMLRIVGPIIQCQFLESALLNIMNFQSLIATKASRICYAAGENSTILEFGLRRAQGIDGSLSASKAAFIGGCSATSNVLAGKLYNIPVKGTHAHSWVMSFDNEYDSFLKYSETMPNNCVFLVDTYNTIEGVKNAIKVGKLLRNNNNEMIGIRLDSGDLAYLSKECRKLLDDNGFNNVKIIASNDLDEELIMDIKNQGGKIDIWGVGTNLITAKDQPALGGVYKLSAIYKDNKWIDKIKMSEQKIKISNPGILEIKRFYNDDLECIGDCIYDVEIGCETYPTIIDPNDDTRSKILNNDRSFDLLKLIYYKGQNVYKCPSVLESKHFCNYNLKKIHESIKRFKNPHEYPVGLEQRLYNKKNQMIKELRK